MARSLAVLSLAAGLVAGIDLAHKAVAVDNSGGALFAHSRSALYVVGVVVVSIFWAGAIALTRSVSIALGGGVLAGGAVGNLVSLALWPAVPGVPNPLVAGELAFNVADLAVVVGLALVLCTTTVFAVRNRERLREPVRVRA